MLWGWIVMYRIGYLMDGGTPHGWYGPTRPGPGLSPKFITDSLAPLRVPMHRGGASSQVQADPHKASPRSSTGAFSRLSPELPPSALCGLWLRQDRKST